MDAETGEWIAHLNTYLLKTKGTTGEKADNYFLFFPDAEPEIAPKASVLPPTTLLLCVCGGE